MIRLIVLVLAALTIAAAAVAANHGSNEASVRIWVVGVDGKGLRALTRGALDYSPAISPNGRSIAFARGAQEGSSDIWVVGANGGIERQLTATPEDESDPQWSPDGRFISYSVRRYYCPVHCVEWRIEIRRSNGAGATTVIPAARHLRWSRDGRIVYESNVDEVYGEARAIAVARPRGDARTLAAGAIHTSPQWSPTGRWVAFHENRGESDMLRVVRSTGRGVRTIDRAAGPMTWSPGGRWIAYQRSGTIYRVRLDGRARRRVVVGAGPAWAPRGTMIAFQGRRGLSIIRQDGRGLRRLTSLSSSSTLVWSPDGTKIYFSHVPS